MLCLAFCLFSDGFIHGFQMNKVKIQLTDTTPSSLIRRNILHSETTSNRQSSSLLAKLPTEPAFQELNSADDSTSQKNKVKSRKRSENGGAKSNAAEGVEDKAKLSNTNSPGNSRGGNSRNEQHRRQSNDLQTFLMKLEQAVDSDKLRMFVKVLKSLAMENLYNINIGMPELIALLEEVKVSNLDSSMTSDMIWSLGKLNFVVVNSEHKPILMKLMNRFCEHSFMSPREVTTSLVSPFLNQDHI